MPHWNIKLRLEKDNCDSVIQNGNEYVSMPITFASLKEKQERRQTLNGGEYPPQMQKSVSTH